MPALLLLPFPASCGRGLINAGTLRALLDWMISESLESFRWHPGQSSGNGGCLFFRFPRTAVKHLAHDLPLALNFEQSHVIDEGEGGIIYL